MAFSWAGSGGTFAAVAFDEGWTVSSVPPAALPPPPPLPRPPPPKRCSARGAPVRSTTISARSAGPSVNHVSRTGAFKRPPSLATWSNATFPANPNVKICWSDAFSRRSTLLLIHGTQPDADAWGQLPDLLAARHRVITYDRRGFSRSRHAPIKDYLLGGARRAGVGAGASRAGVGVGPGGAGRAPQEARHAGARPHGTGRGIPTPPARRRGRRRALPALGARPRRRQRTRPLPGCRS